VHDLPAWLRIATPFPFVGRTSELEVLRTLLPTASGEGRRVLLLGGEAGVGKSRLAREFAAEAARDGTLVLYGQCDAVVPTPYGPFVPALEQLLRAIDPAELTAILDAGAGDLSRLLPELARRTGKPAPPVKADPDTERHRLHSAVTYLFAHVSQRRPVLVVLEDVHWADAPTVLLLRHLARGAWAGRVVVFATFRDAEADLPELLSQTLADLRRRDDVVRLRLGGLTQDEVTEFVTRAVEGHAGADLAEVAGTISDLTGGVQVHWRDLCGCGDGAEGVA